MISKAMKVNLKNGSMIRKMFEEGERLKAEYGQGKVFDFSIGNPEIEPPKEVKTAFRDLAHSSEKGMHRYMPNAGYPSTREAMAQYVSQSSGVKLTADNIVMTVGAAGGLNVVLKSILDADDEVIVLSPYFVEYLFYIANSGGKPVIVRTDNNFMPDIKAIAHAVTSKTKAVIINTPNNPTGAVYSGEVLTKLKELLQKKEEELNIQIYVLSDEPYEKIVYDDVIVRNILDIFPNGIIINSFSKSLALPGERIGFIAANPNMKDIDELMGAMIFANRSLGFVNAPATAQRIAEKAVKSGVKVNVETYQRKRDILYDNLTAFGFECIKPQGAFYLFVKTPFDDVEFCKIAGEKYRILAVPGAGFGEKGYMRLCYCVSEDIIVRSLPFFKKLAEEYII